MRNNPLTMLVRRLVSERQEPCICNALLVIWPARAAPGGCLGMPAAGLGLISRRFIHEAHRDLIATIRAVAASKPIALALLSTFPRNGVPDPNEDEFYEGVGRRCQPLRHAPSLARTCCGVAD
jgi:hypothetical protein